MHILTVNQNYPKSVAEYFCNNLYSTGYQGQVYLFSNLDEPICSTRMFAWLDFVKGLPKDEFILLTDLRDVLFQDNPEKLTRDGLHVFCEDDNYTLKTEPYNRSWILQGWGEEGLLKIGNRSIVCAGVTFGRQPDIETYLRKQCQYLEQPQFQFRGADQGVHNWMVWNKELDCMVHGNRSDMVYTVGLVPMLRVKHHEVYNCDNIKPTIVHQYDRHFTLV